MYLSHYNLKEKPFQISTDPKFIWLGENHREALAVLEYSVIENKGFLLITGDVGTGKTTLINALLMMLGNDAVVANVANPVLEKLDFFNIVANEFKINRYFKNKAAFLIYFSRFLNDCYTKKKKVVLIIDEAHKLDPDLLEQIRLLSNIERQDTKLLNICFVGQNEFIDIISDNQQRALRQRIAINFHLDPLNESEVKAYIHHRLNVAGLKENIFSDSSIREIFSFSNGYPRLINIICDHALLTGYVNEVKTIDEGIIKECANGLFLTRGNKGYDKNDRKPIQGTMSMDEKVAPTTPSGYTGKSDLPKERGGYLHDNPATIERIAYSYGEKPTLKSSKKKYGYGVCALLLLLLLGFLYDPVNLGGHIDNIKTYFKPFPELKENNMSANIPQNTASRQNMNAVVKVVDKSSDTQLQPTGLVAESYHQPMIVEAVNDTEPLKESSINALPSAEDLSQDEYQDNSAKAQDAPVYDLIRTRKYIINFKYNSYDIAGDSLPILEGIAELLDQHAKIGIVVKGYTDAYGNPRYNTKLSKLRAGFVKSYLVDRGINASRIKALGLGEKSPIGSNDTIEARKTES